jgi:predicted permease
MLATGTSILDARVLIFTILVSVLSGVGFSLIPALGAARSNVLLAMKNDSPSSSSGRPRAALRGALTVFQIAASVVLLVTTLLFLRTFWNDSRVQLAFDPNHILMVYPRLQGYDAAAEKSFFDNFVESVKTIPGVRAAAVGSPAAPGWSIGMPEGMYYVSRITTDYFSVLNIPILRGRNFNTQDRRGAPYVGVVNERMARKFWPGKDAVGQRLDHVLTGDATVEIVGVVPDTRKEGIGAPEDPTLYLQLDQFYSAYPYRIGSVLLVRSDGDIAALLPGLRGVLNRLDKDVTLSGTQSVGEFLALRFQDIRFLTELLGVFATLAIILAATGLYGLVAYITTARTSEFGLRLALGASQADIVRLVLRHGILRALAGVALGLGLATVLTGFLAGFLHGVKGVDAETFGIVAIILCGVALVASYIPARRASRLAPMAALRQD